MHLFFLFKDKIHIKSQHPLSDRLKNKFYIYNRLLATKLLGVVSWDSNSTSVALKDIWSNSALSFPSPSNSRMVMLWGEGVPLWRKWEDIASNQVLLVSLLQNFSKPLNPNIYCDGYHRGDMFPTVIWLWNFFFLLSIYKHHLVPVVAHWLEEG